MSIILTYLTTGNLYKSPGNVFIVSISSISKIVAETCFTIIEVFHDKVMLTPSPEAEWRSIALYFQEHALNAIDEKHIRIREPPNSSSEYYNYKRLFSILLFALSDANLAFRYVEIG